jgi:hypothetical protein
MIGMTAAKFCRVTKGLWRLVQMRIPFALVAAIIISVLSFGMVWGQDRHAPKNEAAPEKALDGNPPYTITMGSTQAGGEELMRLIRVLTAPDKFGNPIENGVAPGAVGNGRFRQLPVGGLGRAGPPDGFGSPFRFSKAPGIGRVPGGDRQSTESYFDRFMRGKLFVDGKLIIPQAK